MQIPIEKLVTLPCDIFLIAWSLKNIFENLFPKSWFNLKNNFFDPFIFIINCIIIIYFKHVHKSHILLRVSMTYAEKFWRKAFEIEKLICRSWEKKKDINQVDYLHYQKKNRYIYGRWILLMVIVQLTSFVQSFQNNFLNVLNYGQSLQKLILLEKAV